MKYNKILVILLVSVIMITLSGCMCENVVTDIEANGSGTVNMKIGYSQTFYDHLEEMKERNSENYDDVYDTGMGNYNIQYQPVVNPLEGMNTFKYNGNTYYGTERDLTFDSLEELNKILNDKASNPMSSENINANINSTIEFSRGENNAIQIKLILNPQTNEPVTFMGREFTVDEVKSFYNQALVIFEFSLPNNVSQTSGPDYGVTIEENKLTLNLIKMQNEQTTVYEFTTNSIEEEAMINETPIQYGDPIHIPDRPFPDVAYGDWFFTAVTAMANTGLVHGFDDGNFYPNNNITYSQFCTILCNAKGLEVGSTEESNYWAYKAIKNCLDNGFINKLGDEISPEIYEKEVSREVAISGVVRAYNLKNVYNQYRKSAFPDIPDVDEIDQQYYKDIDVAYNVGLTNGVDDERSFSPKTILTRAQICQLFFNYGYAK